MGRPKWPSDSCRTWRQRSGRPSTFALVAGVFAEAPSRRRAGVPGGAAFAVGAEQRVDDRRVRRGPVAGRDAASCTCGGPGRTTGTAAGPAGSPMTRRSGPNRNWPGGCSPSSSRWRVRGGESRHVTRPPPAAAATSGSSDGVRPARAGSRSPALQRSVGATPELRLIEHGHVVHRGPLPTMHPLADQPLPVGQDEFIAVTNTADV
jgi:hypothetical protein